MLTNELMTSTEGNLTRDEILQMLHTRQQHCIYRVSTAVLIECECHPIIAVGDGELCHPHVSILSTLDH